MPAMKAASWRASCCGTTLEAANRQTKAACVRSDRSDVDCGTYICMARPQPVTQQRLRICGTEFGDDDRYRIRPGHSAPRLMKRIVIAGAVFQGVKIAHVARDLGVS